MAAQAGKDVLVYISDDQSPTNFIQLGGMRTGSLEASLSEVDTTNQSSSGWAEDLDGAGIKRVRLSGTMVFLDTQGHDLLRTAWANRELTEMKITMDAEGDYIGLFKVTRFSKSWEHDGAVMAEMELASSGVISVPA